MPHDPSVYRDLAERSWAWVLTNVRTDGDDLWLPETPVQGEPGEYPYGMHSGVGGLAHVLAEIRLTRELTSGELRLAHGIADTVERRIPAETEHDYFDGLTSTIGILLALDGAGSEPAVARLRELATTDGWQPSWIGPPRAVAEGRCNDATLGNAAVLLGALWALRYGVHGAAGLAQQAADIVLAEREEVPTGLDWLFVPRRYLVEARGEMPNWSHGLAGIAGSLAAAGVALGRPELTDAARLGAEHLVSLADTSDGGMRVAHVIPDQEDLDTFTYTWCHGPAGTSLLFAGLSHAGVTSVAGRTPYDWERACLHSLKVSGIPERRYPGFWDNDGRCCGTARTTTSCSRRRSPTRSSTVRSPTETTSTGASSSIATRTRSSRRGPATCRAPPASRRTCSGSPGCCSRAAPPRPSRAWTPGGRCPSPGAALGLVVELVGTLVRRTPPV